MRSLTQVLNEKFNYENPKTSIADYRGSEKIFKVIKYKDQEGKSMKIFIDTETDKTLLIRDEYMKWVPVDFPSDKELKKIEKEGSVSFTAMGENGKTGSSLSSLQDAKDFIEKNKK
jgi:hypothetical protein